MKTFFNTLPAALLLLLLTYAAFSKLLTFGEFRVQLYLQPFPRAVSDILIYLLPAAELAVAALLEIMMNETTPFRRKLTHCFGAN